MAYDSKLDRKVAIKLLSKESTAEDQSKKRLLREARAAAKLDHPNICAIYEVGEENGVSFIVMQYIEGKTLAERFCNETLALKEALDIAIQVTDALVEAHSQGIIHRDIKPQNIMITLRNQVKVLDFGLAKKLQDNSLRQAEEDVESVLTSPGLVIGTVPYMSPEQAKGEMIDGRSDIFSFGTLLYEMLTGRHPFRNDSVAATIAAILMSEPPPLNQFNQSVPPELQRIVGRTLQKEKEERYQSAPDLLLDLRKLRQQPIISNDQIQFTMKDSVPTVVATDNQVKVDTPKIPADQSTEIRPLTTSGISQLDSETKSRKKGIIIVITLLFIGILMLAILMSLRTSMSKQGTDITEIATSKQTVPAIRSFTFDVVNIDKNGKVLERRQKYSRYLSEDLGGGVTLEMVEIPGGAFFMGTSEDERYQIYTEQPMHQVSLPIFYMGKLEVTQAQWRAVVSLPKVNRDLSLEPSYFKGDKLPVEQVSWADAKEFCDRLSQKTGRKYRLPSEAEWEYACRAGTATPFSFGQTITKEFVNFFDYTDLKKQLSISSREESESELKAFEEAMRQAMNFANTTPVGMLGAIGDSLVANAFGLSDMHGNVSEWCLDAYHENYFGAPFDGSVWDSDEQTDSEVTEKVVRGGDFLSDLDQCRAASRSYYPSENKDRRIGFRVVLVRTW